MKLRVSTVYDIISDGCEKGIEVPKMEYLLGIAPAELAVVVGMLCVLLGLLVPGRQLLARPDYVHQVLIHRVVLFDLVHVVEDEVVFEVAFRGVEHERLVLRQLQLCLVSPPLRQHRGHRVLEQHIPLDSAFDVGHQHLPERICEFGTYRGLGGEEQRPTFDKFEEIDHVAGDVGRSSYYDSYLP